MAATNGFIGKVHHLGAKVGGTFRLSFSNFTTGKSYAFGGEYREIEPNARLQYTAVYDGPTRQAGCSSRSI